MSKVHDVIKNMSSEVRKKAEAYAQAKGISLEAAVSKQLEGELTDGDLDAIAGGTVYNVESPDGWEYVTYSQSEQ